jgi:hypothetical protein
MCIGEVAEFWELLRKLGMKGKCSAAMLSVLLGFVLPIIVPCAAQTTISLAGTNVVLRFPTTTNLLYNVQRTGGLGLIPWSTIVSNLVGTGGVRTNIDIGAATVASQFYRVGSYNPSITGGTVSVSVRFSDGSPVSAALVIISYSGNPQKSGYTDSNGILTIPNVPVGSFSVQAYYGDESAGGSGSISGNGNIASVTVTLPGTGTVNLQVNFANGSNAAFSATFIVYGGATNGPANTSANGQLTYLDVPVGDFIVIAHDPNNFASSTNGTGNIPSNGATVNLTIALPP